jgi:hypothetical protein
MVHFAFLFLLQLPLAQSAGAFPPGAESPAAAPQIIAESEPPPLAPDSPEFNQRMLDSALRIEVRSGDGVLIREASAVLTDSSGYVMTSLDAVVGGSVYMVSGGPLKAARSATPLAVTRQGDLAILQLQVSRDERLARPPRAKSPPVPGDRVYAALPGTSGRKEGKVLSVSGSKDGSRLLKTSLPLEPGSGLYNGRGELVAIVRKAGKAATSSLAVYAPGRMRGTWVGSFPSRLGDALEKISPEEVKFPY